MTNYQMTNDKIKERKYDKKPQVLIDIFDISILTFNIHLTFGFKHLTFR